jgi:hypothetical protein
MEMETAFISEASTNYKSTRRRITENYLFVTWVGECVKPTLFRITPPEVASTQTSRQDLRLPPRYGYELRSSVGYYAASNGNFFLNSWPLKVRPTGCSETSVGNQLHTLRKNKEKRSSEKEEYFCCGICFDRCCAVIKYTLLFPLRNAGQWRHKEEQHSETLPVSTW